MSKKSDFLDEFFDQYVTLIMCLWTDCVHMEESSNKFRQQPELEEEAPSIQTVCPANQKKLSVYRTKKCKAPSNKEIILSFVALQLMVDHQRTSQSLLVGK